VSATIDPLPYDAIGHDDHDDDDHVHAEGDPHVWMDPNNVILWVEVTVEALSEADPSNAQAYEANGAEYIAKLSEIDEWIRDEPASIPEARRKLVADHSVFNYVADEYDFTMLGAIIPSTTDTAEPSAQKVAELGELIREENVRAIFVGRSSSRALTELSRSISQEVDVNLVILPTFTGSLAPEGEDGDTYLEFLRYNVNQILAGIGE